MDAQSSKLFTTLQCSLLLCLLLLLLPQRSFAQTPTSKPFFALSTAPLDDAALLEEFTQAKASGFTGLVVNYETIPQLDLYLQAANASNMQLLLATEARTPSNAHAHYANEAAFTLFQKPLLLTNLSNYQDNSAPYDGVLWEGTTQLTELPENLTAAKQVVDRMFALRKRVQRQEHVWMVLVSAENSDLATDVNSALAVSPDAIVVSDWFENSAEIRAEIEAPRTSVDEFYAAANAYSQSKSNPLEKITLFGGMALALFGGGVLIARQSTD